MGCGGLCRLDAGGMRVGCRDNHASGSGPNLAPGQPRGGGESLPGRYFNLTDHSGAQPITAGNGQPGALAVP